MSGKINNHDLSSVHNKAGRFQSTNRTAVRTLYIQLAMEI